MSVYLFVSDLCKEGRVISDPEIADIFCSSVFFFFLKPIRTTTTFFSSWRNPKRGFSIHTCFGSDQLR